MGNLLLMPAYGRDYEDIQSLLIDWREGKDFKLLSGPYCSSRDINLMKEDGYTTVQFVFNKFTKTHWIEI